MAGKLRVTLVKSPISYTSKARGTVRALGLHRIGETVDVPDTPATRGMARAVRFLVRAEEVPAQTAAETTAATRPVAPEPAAAAPADEEQQAAAPARPRRRRAGTEEKASDA